MALRCPGTEEAVTPFLEGKPAVTPHLLRSDSYLPRGTKNLQRFAKVITAPHIARSALSSLISSASSLSPKSRGWSSSQEPADLMSSGCLLDLLAKTLIPSHPVFPPPQRNFVLSPQRCLWSNLWFSFAERSWMAKLFPLTPLSSPS